MSDAAIAAGVPLRLRARDWLALQALALWPHGAYLVQRAGDGSDDPLGLVALISAAGLVAWRADTLRPVPRLTWFAPAIALTLAANMAWSLGAPALAAGVVAALALGASLAAWWPRRQPIMPTLGLLLLALPLVATLQFYLGYPLRVLTAEASAWLLQAAGLDAQRSGASMQIGGVLVLVDAPCSGVQMAWWGYFSACASAAVASLRDGAFARRLPLVGLLVLLANVLRNSVLVTLETRTEGLSPTAHAAIGVGVLALVCLAAHALMTRSPKESV